MTITVSPSFEELTMVFENEIPMDLVSGGIGSFTYNCEATDVTIDMEVLLDTLDGQTVTLNATDVYDNRTTFKDGVYNFSFEIYADGSTHAVTYCLFIGTTSNCKVTKLVLCQEDELLEYLWKALQYVNECDDCTCSTMCTVYEALQNRIDYLASKTTTTNVYNDCGC